MNTRLLFLIILVLYACQNSVKKEKTDDTTGNFVLNDSAEEMPDTNLLNKFLEPDTMSFQQKRILSRLIFPYAAKPMDFRQLKADQLVKTYENVLKYIRFYQDSSAPSQLFLSDLYQSLEMKQEELNTQSALPVDVQLQIATIKSDIHSGLAKFKQKKT